jgi:hypothetical protein
MSTLIPGDTLKVENYDFKRIDLAENVDISEWMFLLRDGKTNTYKTICIKDFLDRSKRSNNIKALFARNVAHDERIFFLVPKLKILDKGLVSIIEKIVKYNISNNVVVDEYSPDSIETKISSSNIKNHPLIIFMYEEMLEQYPRLKRFLLENNIKSQFVRLDVIRDKKFLLKNSLVLEISQKIGRKLICLDPAFIKVTNILYLTDLDIQNKLFLISYEKIEQADVKEKVRVFQNTETEINDRKNLLYFGGRGIDILVDKVCNIGIQPGEVDLYLTRFIKYFQLNQLITQLKNKGINIRKVFFVSNQAVKGPAEVSLNPLSFSFPYNIIGDKVAILKSVNKINWFGDLFPLWCHQLYPQQGKITDEDVEAIIWSIKKRTYRIDNFANLKLPEALSIFRNPRKNYLKDLEFNQDIELSLLI